MQKIKKRPEKHRSKRKWLLIAAILLVIAAGTFALLEATDRINLLGGDNQPETTIGQQTKGEPAEPKEPDTEKPGGQPGDNSKSRNETNPNQTLRAPTGDFVSNHEPNLSNSPAPNTLASVCVTTPGGTCTITFEKDGIVKSLPAQTADAEGAAYWNWKLQDHGLTEGKWRIQAKATLDDQTKTAEDPLLFNVKP